MASKKATGSVQIFAPNREFDGVVAGVAFSRGRAKADHETDAGAIAYFRRQGYGIGEEPKRPAPAPSPAVSALEAAAVQSVGGRLRDAAVDPHPDDFLPPVNAGKADPHGPLVVAPEIHHDGPAGLRPGVVAVDDPKRQSREERATAKAVLVENQDKGEALGVFGPEADTGDLGLSDPGSADAGREGAAEVAAAEADDAPPAKSANKPEWVAYAVSQGMDPAEAEAAKKDDLVERYGG